ncbi:hypothetical protein TYRP_010561 [Tyrophagus putrescentiae]|nr:hypothetical protein TYRP_010561 [Tyrophagus putrescentiae]
MKEHHHQQRRALNTEGNPDWSRHEKRAWQTRFPCHVSLALALLSAPSRGWGFEDASKSSEPLVTSVH